MRDRDSQVGRPVKLCRKRKPLPANYLEWLAIAKNDGEDFSPNLVELYPAELRRAFQVHRAKYKRIFRRNFGFYHAVLAMFHYSLSEYVLANRKQEEGKMIYKALRSSIQAQNHLLSAFIWLDSSGRLAFIDSWQHLDIQHDRFFPFCQSAMASARLAYAAAKAGAKVRIASIENDMHRKIDLFLDHPMLDYPTLCVQVKPKSTDTGVRFTLLNEKPYREGMMSEYETQISVWRGVCEFNLLYNRDWVGLIALVGTDGVSADTLEDPLVINDTCDFFNSLSKTRKGSYDSTHPACA